MRGGWAVGSGLPFSATARSHSNFCCRVRTCEWMSAWHVLASQHESLGCAEATAKSTRRQDRRNGVEQGEGIVFKGCVVGSKSAASVTYEKHASRTG
eukprot:985500-Rhodomonas_salina.1